MVAKHVAKIILVSPEGNFNVTNLPSFAINWAKVPALRAIIAP
jgi:hypothetical protein